MIAPHSPASVEDGTPALHVEGPPVDLILTCDLSPGDILMLTAAVRDLHAQGRTIVMTTHYMPEADELSDRIALIDRGRLLALDTPENLKKQTPDGSLETFFISKSGRGWDA